LANTTEETKKASASSPPRAGMTIRVRASRQDAAGLRATRAFCRDGFAAKRRASRHLSQLTAMIPGSMLMRLLVHYNFEFRKSISFALDLQGIDRPAYNRDRGPVLVVSGRLQFEF
jgi:hypothetical protein